MVSKYSKPMFHCQFQSHYYIELHLFYHQIHFILISDSKNLTFFIKLNYIFCMDLSINLRKSIRPYIKIIYCFFQKLLILMNSTIKKDLILEYYLKYIS